MFSREHRSGIFLLLLLIFFGQLSYFFLSENLFQKKEIKEDKEWLLVHDVALPSLTRFLYAMKTNQLIKINNPTNKNLAMLR